jgi:hypothetical protein
MSAWRPFDQARLEAVVRTDHDELANWLDDHRTLPAPARKHGVDGSATSIAHRLVAPRQARAAAAHQAALAVRLACVTPEASRHSRRKTDPRGPAAKRRSTIRARSGATVVHPAVPGARRCSATSVPPRGRTRPQTATRAVVARATHSGAR